MLWQHITNNIRIIHGYSNICIANRGWSLSICRCHSCTTNYTNRCDSTWLLLLLLWPKTFSKYHKTQTIIKFWWQKKKLVENSLKTWIHNQDAFYLIKSKMKSGKMQLWCHGFEFGICICIKYLMPVWRTGVPCNDRLADEQSDDAVKLADSQCCTNAFRRASSSAISVSLDES